MHFLSANPGAGKTFVSINEAIRLATAGEFVVYAMKSLLSIKETRDKYLSGKHIFFETFIISSDDESSEPPVSRIIKKMQKPKGGMHQKGTLLIICQQSLLRLPYHNLLAGKILIIDEIPQVVERHELSVALDLSILKSHVSVLPYHVTGYVQLAPASKGRDTIRRVAKQLPGTAVDLPLKKLLLNLTSPWFRIVVRDEELAKLRSGGAPNQKIEVYSRLSYGALDSAKSVLIGGAHFKESLFYHYGILDGVEFKERLDLKERLRFTISDVGPYTTIFYAHCGDWSVSLYNRKIPGDEQTSILRMVAEKVSAFFDDEPFLFSANKSIPDDLILSPKAVRLPNVSHGLNTFSHIHNAVFLAALNPQTPEFGFHRAHGISSEEVKSAIYREGVAQGLGRCSTRVLGSTELKKIVVMDKSTAEWLQADFPGSTLVSLDWIPTEIGLKTKPGPKPLHANNGDKQYVYRERKKNKVKKQELVDSMNRVRSLDVGALAPIIAKAMSPDIRDGLSIDSNRYIVTQFYGMQFETKVATESEFIHFHDGDDEFIKKLRILHSQPWREKETAPLISPSFFNPGKSKESRRGLENIEFSRGIWLDNDGGDLTHSEFVELFPSLRIVVFNSQGSTNEKPKWRAFIPTTTGISREAHEFVVDTLFECIKAAGFLPADQAGSEDFKFDGFDRTKKGPASLFRIPYQAANPDDSFFIDHNELGRSAIDVDDWIDGIVEEQPDKEAAGRVQSEAKAEIVECDQIAIDEAIQKWRNCSIPGEGNTAFLRLGLKLSSAGMTERQIRQTLDAEYRYGRSPRERKYQIPSIISSLKRYGKLPR